MADGSSSGPAPALVRGGILRDPVDLRDRAYEPTLARLAPELPPDARLVAMLRKRRKYWALPREQGDEGTCGGHALAALIDLERLRSGNRRHTSVSARMLYQTARLKYDPGEPEGVSLRDVIKAFYNYGVCSEKRWPYVAGEAPPSEIDIERAREARKVTLGAYYRLRPNLNTYHAALHEAGALLVSAELHDGWLPDHVARAGGEIVPPKPGEHSPVLGTENHAFLIVGYTPRGFLVLNSWGRDWGGWSPGRSEPPIPGVALWRYGDWADRIIDGWVLRLGAGASDAFEYSIGDMGLGFGADTAARSTPIHAILGNFLHLDDGEFVTTGGHVSSPQTLRETARMLTEKTQVKGVLLTFAGGLVGLKGAAEQIARWKRLVRDEGWHPFTVLWCVDYVERARAVLDGVFAEAMARAGNAGPQFDRAVEENAHGVGRALWRDIRCAAEHGARHGGPLHQLVRAGLGIAAARGDGFGLRIVAESEGAFALAALLGALGRPDFTAEAAGFFDMLESVDLVAPPMTDVEYSGLALYLNAGWGPRHPDRRIRLHLPTAEDERRLAVPPYGLSYFELVRRAFHRRSRVRDEEALARAERAKRRAADPQHDFRGFVEPIAAGPSGIATKWDACAAAPRTTLAPIGWPENRRPDGQAPITQLDLLYRSDVAGRLRAALADARTRTRTREPALS
jgi:hypothetical protein